MTDTTDIKSIVRDFERKMFQFIESATLPDDDFGVIMGRAPDRGQVAADVLNIISRNFNLINKVLDRKKEEGEILDAQSHEALSRFHSGQLQISRRFEYILRFSENIEKSKIARALGNLEKSRLKLGDTIEQNSPSNG